MTRLGLITKSRSVFDTFLSQIKDVLGELVSVVGYCLDEQSPVRLECDLCLVSFFEIRELAEELTHKKVIVAQRTLNIAQLNKVFELKEGTKVYVVNNFKESAEESVELLQTMGLSHLNLFPYYPGNDLPLNDISVAITPGMSSLVPSFVTKIIDIGNRIIDVSTFIEISVLCNFPMDRAHFITARTVNQIVNLQMEQSNLVRSLKKMNKQMQIVLDNISDGVIAIDHQQKIVSCNDFAKVLLKVPLDKDLTSEPLYHIIPGLNLGSITENGIPEINKLWKINNTQMLVTKTPLFDDLELNGVILILKHISETKKSIERQNCSRNSGYIAKYTFSNLLAQSESMKSVIHTAQKIATTDLPVLILGESGTGKELLAQAIHNASWRQNQPFIAINLAALPETLVESELFGYEEGAFTGAQKAGKPGLFELAIGGTFFLDEIGEISPHIQVKLLRVLEEKEIMRIGGTKIIPIDVRIIAATNQDIVKMVKEGSFRRDLYYRVCVFPLEIPPLRSRADDIMALGEYFFSSYNEKNTKITRDTLDLMLAYDWPGNVRELKEIIGFCTQLGEDEHECFELFHQTLYRLTERATLKSTGEAFESNWESLSAMGNAREFLAMLEELIQAKKNGERIGRESLQRKLESKGIHLSQQQVRTRLESLQKLGCIKSGSGRRGSFITSEGERLLHYLES